MDLTSLKHYLRIEHSEDDLELTAMMGAAQAYINGQTGKTEVKTGVDVDGLPVYGPITASELYSLAVKIVVSHWYSLRGIETPGTTTKFGHSFDAICTHISLCGDYR